MTKKDTKKKKERRKKIRTMHVINKNTADRNELLAYTDLVNFLTKRL